MRIGDVVKRLGEEHEVEGVVREGQELAGDHVGHAVGVVDVHRDVARVRRQVVAVGLGTAEEVEYVVHGVPDLVEHPFEVVHEVAQDQVIRLGAPGCLRVRRIRSS